MLTAAERASFRESARLARTAKLSAMAGDGPAPLHSVNVPALDTRTLMPQLPANGCVSLSIFSGGGGLDLGFSRAGFAHAASYELMEIAAETLRNSSLGGQVFGGAEGDVQGVDWRPWKGQVDVLHGGPPCQPFSHAGRQRGKSDPRDMWPEFVRAVMAIRPKVFVGENVSALGDTKFEAYVDKSIVSPLSGAYHITKLLLRAQDFGIPQVRRRIFFIGFRNKRNLGRFKQPRPTHGGPDDIQSRLPSCIGVRRALGLPDIGHDDLAPTIRSTLNGPRNTTSILNSVSAKRKFERLQVWPNGVAPTRLDASKFPAPNGHFRMSVQDVALIQGFPDDWKFAGATYKVLGQIGNAVPPPLAYYVARSVAVALGLE